MTNNIVNILGVQFNNLKQSDALKIIIEKIKKNERVFVTTANPEIVMYANRNVDYKRLINTSDLIVADGIGIIYGSKILRQPLLERIAGYDLLIELLKQSSEHNLRVYLLGAKEEIVNKAKENIIYDYPNINIVGTHNGFFDIEDMSIMEKVENAKPQIIFVAMGFPKQEQWISKYFKRGNTGLGMGVGGSFDVLSGETKRAPKWVQKVHLEWLYRLINDPKRAVRMLDLPKFIIEVIKQRRKSEAR